MRGTFKTVNRVAEGIEQITINNKMCSNKFVDTCSSHVKRDDKGFFPSFLDPSVWEMPNATGDTQVS